MTRRALPRLFITDGDTIRAVAIADELRAHLRDLIEKKALNQKDLAKAIGASQGYVSMILSGQRLGNEVALLDRLAHALDRSLSTLIREAERRDLLRHDRTGQLGSHLEGDPDVPDADRVRELERQIADERQEHAEQLAALQSLNREIFRVLAGAKIKKTAPDKSKGRRAHRRAG